jgi:hypothetical protein
VDCTSTPLCRDRGERGSRVSYDSASLTSILLSARVTWNATLRRLSDGVALNRCFPDKAVAIWHQLDDQGHVHLVEEYLREPGNFENVRDLDRSPRRMFSDPLYAVIGQSTGPHPT